MDYGDKESATFKSVEVVSIQVTMVGEHVQTRAGAARIALSGRNIRTSAGGTWKCEGVCRKEGERGVDFHDE